MSAPQARRLSRPVGAVLRSIEVSRFNGCFLCRTGNRTTQMRRVLMAQGFTQVYNIREGMAGGAAGPGWIRQSLPAEPRGRC